MNDGGVDIDLPGAQEFVITHEDLAGSSGITQGFGAAIQLQAGVDAANTGARPAYFISYR